jgi:DNA-binding SARP family transcriptional activator
LEVRDDGAPVRLGGPRQRALLARLALEPGRTVSVDTLLEDLWGEHQPPTAVKMIHVAVSQLRKVLPAGSLQTRAPGYVLHSATDLARFDELRAAGRLDDALALWRGPALAEFASEPFATPEGARLEELRLAALEDRIEADLACGRASEVVGELESLIARHPLRESVRRRQMLALYRSGRQAEALTAYQEARRTLAEELGLEPSPALRELQRQILSHDPALEATASAPRAPATLPETRYARSGDVGARRRRAHVRRRARTCADEGAHVARLIVRPRPPQIRSGSPGVSHPAPAHRSRTWRRRPPRPRRARGAPRCLAR